MNYKDHVSQLKNILGALEKVNIKEYEKDTSIIIEVGTESRSVRLVLPRRYRQPDEIDMLFSDIEKQKGYVIYITEVDDGALASIFKDIHSLAKAFIENNYTIIQKRGLLTPKDYLVFDIPGVVYTTASAVNNFSDMK